MRRKIRKKEALLRDEKILEEDVIRSVNSLIAHAKHANVDSLLRKEVLASLRMA